MFEHRPVVVGIDNDPDTDLALRWGVAEARSRRVPLRLVYAYEWTPRSLYIGADEFVIDRATQLAEQLGATVADRVMALAPDVEVSAEAIDGEPVPVLLEESENASVVVVGSRRLKALGSNVLGSVGAGVAARARCPVVVIRGQWGDPAERAAVVVGIDGTDADEALLAFGFDHASRHQVSLRAVLCWRPDALARMQWRGEPAAPERADRWLAEALAGWRDKYPDVPVSKGVVRDHPVAGLVAESAAQYLLVVGTHGHHALSGTLLGSVSQGVLHHATCPVAVIPRNGES